MIERAEWLDEIQPESIDTLAVLGRGKGDTALHRGEVAAEIVARMPEGSNVIFCGGNSWNEDPSGSEISESDIALDAALLQLTGQSTLYNSRCQDFRITNGVTLLNERRSRSTIENLCNAADILTMRNILPRRMAIMSDDLHFRYHRPTNAARLVFPQAEIVDIALEREHSARDIVEEWLITKGTNFFMRDVKPGDHAAIRKQQLAFENANRKVRAIAGRPLRVFGK